MKYPVQIRISEAVMLSTYEHTDGLIETAVLFKGVYSPQGVSPLKQFYYLNVQIGLSKFHFKLTL